MNNQTNCTKCGVPLLRKNAQCIGHDVFCQKCYDDDNAAILSMLNIGQTSKQSYDPVQSTSTTPVDPKQKLGKTSTGINGCPKCGLPLLSTQATLTFNGISFHEKCFRCTHCAGPLPLVYTRNERHYCESCDLSLFVKKCTVCSKPAREYKFFEGKYYHSGCLRCVECNLPFEAKESVYTKNGKYHCGRCYCINFGKNCKKCGRLVSPINGEETTFKGHSYHKACLVCQQCNNQFPPNSSIYTAKNNENHFYCLSCYDSVFALTCTACRRSIPASRSSVSSGDKSWHKECFKCKRCGKPLSNFYWAGNDIVCTSKNDCK